MPSLSLREAAELARTSKSTIWRAIKSGRMSATRTDDGGFAIDPAELFRVFQPGQPEQRSAGQDATGETALRDSGLERELQQLRDALAAMREDRDATRVDRDAWRDLARKEGDERRDLAQRLALAAPIAAPAPTPAQRRSWFWRKAS
jgi:excisionase family DNA binding protein